MMTKAQTAERLLQVVRVLDELPPEKRFDMDTWYMCGTVGCALGWSSVDPWFTQRGLKLVALYTGSVYKSPQYKGREGIKAAAAFFGIGHWEAQRLFMPGGYRSGNPRRATVAKKIRAFVTALPA